MHLNIEARLTQLVGMAGKRLHTGRAATTRWPPTCACGCATNRPDRRPAGGPAAPAGPDVAEKRGRDPAGFTHLQVAQPVSFGHHMLAYVEMFSARCRALGPRA